MAANCRFAFAVHLLSVLACHPGDGVTSSQIARSVNTNPVVIRRLLISLRRAGFICTKKGARSGSHLCCAPEAISLDAIYRAVETASSFSLHPQTPNRRCPVGRRIEEVLGEVFASAQSALETELSRRTLADLLENMDVSSSPPPSARKSDRAIRGARIPRKLNHTQTRLPNHEIEPSRRPPC